MADVAGATPAHQPIPTRKAQTEKYNQLQAKICQQIDDLLQQAEAVLTTKQFEEARNALNSVYRRINKLAYLSNRRGGEPRRELKRLIRYYSLYQRALAGAVSATKGELNAARVLLPLAYQQSKQLRLDYPKSREVTRLAGKIRSWQKLLKRP